LKTRLGVGSILLAAFLLAAIAMLGTACPTTYDLVTSAEVPFDGNFLGACTPDSAPHPVDPSLCKASCVNGALAYCVGTSYAECACSLAPPCDSGCCANALTGYVPQACTGKSALTDPSEGLCDAELGYLLCNSLCYASFVCELPAGYTVMQSEAGPRDAGNDARSDAEVDAHVDAQGDAPTDAPTDGHEDHDLDAHADAHD
jgi:hypothetical protein